MTPFIVTGSGIVNLSNQDFPGFDAIAFQTSGTTTVILKSTQFGPGVPELGTDTAFLGSGFSDRVQIGIAVGATFTGSSFSLSGWSNADVFTFFDNTGNETITGTQGNDRFHVTRGSDVVDGNMGKDDVLFLHWSDLTSSIASNSATFTDFASRSVSFANIDRFVIEAGSGNDYLQTQGGNDLIKAGAGNDTLASGGGADDVDGGTGIDQWTADFSGSAIARSVDLALTGRQAAGGGSFYTSIERLDLTGSTADDFFASRHSDPLDGLGDTLRGGGGNDTLVVGGGSDFVYGGEGEDTLIIDLAKARLGSNFSMNSSTLTNFSNAAVSFDTIEHLNIRTGRGNDYLLGGDFADTLVGGGGDDTLNTGKGKAVVNGGTGVDLWQADLSAETGGLGIDLTQSGVQRAGRQISFQNIERLGVTGGSGDDRMITRTLMAGDTLDGGLGNDTLGVGGGGDFVTGGDGTDLLIVDWRGLATSVAMTSNLASITDFSGNGVVVSGIEQVWLRFGAGADQLFGAALADTLEGGDGADTLTGGLGADVLTGGTGADRFVFATAAESTAAAPGRDTITDFDTNGDRIDLTQVDAIEGGGRDAFILIGNAAFTALGQLRVFDNGVNTFVEGNTTGGLAADFQVTLRGVIALDGGDFLV